MSFSLFRLSRLITFFEFNFILKLHYKNNLIKKIKLNCDSKKSVATAKIIAIQFISISDVS